MPGDLPAFIVSLVPSLKPTATPPNTFLPHIHPGARALCTDAGLAVHGCRQGLPGHRVLPD
eukprot:3532570-Prymnesium_polylepis.1